MKLRDLRYRISFNLRHPEKLPLMIAEKICNLFFDKLYTRHTLEFHTNGLKRSISFQRNAITEHLQKISEIASKTDGLMVELGTNAGHSTRSLLYSSSNPLISVDVQDFSSLRQIFEKDTGTSFQWEFVNDNDLHFASYFHDFVKSKNLPAKISLLFIDTTHEYEHTLAELRAYVPLMKPGGTILLHDSNLNWFYKRNDKTFGFALSNRRGVARALENYFQFVFNEKVSYDNVTIGKGLKMTHIPTSCGLTSVTI